MLQPSPTHLVIPSLQEMANKGMHMPTLAYMQREAFQVANQVIKRRAHRGEPELTADELQRLVYTHIASAPPKGSLKEVTGIHHRVFACTRALIKHADYQVALTEASELARNPLPASVDVEQGNMLVARQVAIRLNAIEDYAAIVKQNTPALSKLLLQQAEIVASQFPHKEMLDMTRQVLREAGAQAHQEAIDNLDRPDWARPH